MKTLNISEARNALPALVESVAATRAPVILLRYGKPAAMIVPVTDTALKNDPYPLRNVPITIAGDFDTPTPEGWDALSTAEAPGRYGAAPKTRGRKKRRHP